MMWWSIEVLDGEFSAARWHEAHGSFLVEAAISLGVEDWSWVNTRWGVVFELAFADERSWLAFRALPAVQAALDAVPDSVNGLLIYSGRGGSSGRAARRRPRPHLGSGAAALPDPVTEPPLPRPPDPRSTSEDLLPA